MNQFRNLILFFLLLFGSCIYGQNQQKNLTDLFDNFSSPSGWKFSILDYKTDNGIEKHFKQKPIGIWHLENGKTQINYMIFETAISDSLTFKNSVYRYQAISSCNNVYNYKYPFFDIEKDGYYFLLEICPDCNSEKRN